MDNKNKNLDRLRELVRKRVENVQAVRQFEDLFYRFSQDKLKKVVREVNHQFEIGGTDDLLKIYFDDPYQIRKSQYFVLVQLFVGSSKFDYFLDNTKVNPSLLFEGLEFNAKVKVSYKLQNEEQYRTLTEIPVQGLTEDEIQNIIIDFLERVYNK